MRSEPGASTAPRIEVVIGDQFVQRLARTTEDEVVQLDHRRQCRGPAMLIQPDRDLAFHGQPAEPAEVQPHARIMKFGPEEPTMNWTMHTEQYYDFGPMHPIL